MKTVFTNGCFDVIHAGHVHSLKAAREMGDRLIVGLNSDSSVRALKGETRPINNENDRMFVLLAFECVSGVVIFNETTVCELLKKVKPDIWVKSESYSLTTLDKSERLIAESLGVEIRFTPIVFGVSTTSIIEKIKCQENL